MPSDVYTYYDRTCNLAVFNAHVRALNSAYIAQSGTMQALEVANTGTSNALRVKSGAATAALVVGPSGNVGVGVSAPGAPLHVAVNSVFGGGTFRVESDARFTGTVQFGEATATGLLAWLPFAGHLGDISGSNVLGAGVVGGAGGGASGGAGGSVQYNPNGREGTSVVGVNPAGGAAATTVTYSVLGAGTSASAMPSPTAAGGFTVAAWVKPYAVATTGNRQFFFGAEGGFGGTAVPGATILAVGLEPTTNYPVVLLQQAAGNYVTLTVPTVIALNAWTHFAVRLSGTAASPNSTLTLYINGANAGGEQTYTHTTGGAGPAYIANVLLFNGFTGASQSFHGELDTVQVYGRPLTTTEVAALAAGSAEKSPAFVTHSVRINGPLQLSDTTTLDVARTGSSNAASTLQVTAADYQMLDLSGNIASVADATNGSVTPVAFGPFGSAAPTEGSLFLNNAWAGPGTSSNGAYVSALNSNAYGFNWWQNGGFTAEAWVNLKTVPGSGTVSLIGHMTPTSTTDYWSLEVANGILQFYYWNGAGVTVTGVSTLSANTWYHVAVTCDAGSPNNIRLFVNGSLERTTAVSGTPVINAAATPMTIGQLNSGQALNGYVADVRLVRGAALYTATFTPATVPLGPAASGVTVMLLRAAQFPRVPLQLTSDGRMSVAKIGGVGSGAGLSGVAAAPVSRVYPPATLSAHLTQIVGTAGAAAGATTATYGTGYYIATASSETDTSSEAWRAFVGASGSWGSSNAAGYLYNTSAPFGYAGTTQTTNAATGAAVTGEWVQLQLPSAIVLTSYSVSGTPGQTTRGPKRFYVFGSRDGADWRVVSQQSEMPYSATPLMFSVQSTQAYTYYRLVVDQLTGNGATLSVADWTLYGIPEGLSVTADGRVGIGVASPTDALEVAGNAVIGGYCDAALGPLTNVSSAPHVSFQNGRSAQVFLKWLQRTTQALAGSWWQGGGGVPRYSTVAGPPGGYAYIGGVLLPDGRVVFVPHNATTIGLFNPATNAYSTTGTVPGSGAYAGGVLLPDGRVVFVPRNATTIGMFNQATNAYSTIVGPPGNDAYAGGVLLPDGRVVFVPFNTTTIGLFNPATNAYSTIAGPPGNYAYSGGVLLPDGRVVFVPVNATTIGLFNPATNAYSTIAGPPGGDAYRGGVLLPDGRVVFVPVNATTIGLFNPATNAYSTIAGPPGGGAYIGGVLLPDGRVVFVPFNTTTIGLFNPATNAYSTIAGPPGGGAYQGGVLLPDGRVVFAPSVATTIGILSGFPRPPPELCYHPCFNKY